MGLHRSRPTYFTDCPCAQLIVKANTSWTGNCCCLILNVKLVFEIRMNDMQGMSTSCPLLSPPINWTSRTCVDALTTTMWLPLHWPFNSERFHMRSRGQLFLIFSCPGGKLEEV